MANIINTPAKLPAEPTLKPSGNKTTNGVDGYPKRTSTPNGQPEVTTEKK